MREDLTELVFIIDRSGSMYPLTEDTIGGFNGVLQKNKEEPGDCNVTTILFSGDHTLLHDRLPVKAVSPITRKEYQPGGSTALLDAIGAGICKISAVQAATAEAYRAAKVQFVIITDGMENCSREYSKERIRRLITEKQQKENWDFVFLGANFDAVQEAETLGIHADRAVTAMADARGVKAQYESVETCILTNRRAPSCAKRDASWKQAVLNDLASREEI